MDQPENIEGNIPAELRHLTDEELETDFWDSPTCQRCLSYFHPELVQPVHNVPQERPAHIIGNDIILHSKPADLADGLSEGCWWCTRLFSHI